jgi:glutathione reductase (NADPH)
VPAEAEAGLTNAGVRTFHGGARFTDRTTVQVGEQVLNARHVLIATGARPASQAYPGAEHLMTSDRFLELYELPRRIVFVGGGYVSFEFAHVAARAGTQVTILHRGSRPLESFDPDLVALLLERTRALGIDVQLRTEVRGVAGSGSGFTVHSMSEGVSRAFEGDLVVHGAGRMPALASLDLDRAGVAWDQRSVKVNEFLQSVTNPAVYAAGDAAGSGPPLTPVAGVDARVVAANLLDGNHRTPDYSGVASVVFTIPPLASVGLTEAAARAQKRKFRVRHERTSAWYTAKRVAEDACGYKTLVEEGTERILGAHLLGPHAEEVINLFALAVRKGLTSRDFKEAIFAYPTAGSDLAYML